MRKRIRELTQLAVWLLPAGSVKNALLRAAGHDVHPTAIARSNLVWKVASFQLAEGSRIGPANVFKNLRLVSLGEEARIGRLNLFSSHPLFKRHLPGGAALILDDHATITSRHQLDCSGSITLGSFAAFVGHQSRIMSHSIDLTRNAQAAFPVLLGERSFTGARVLILGGATLPPRSVLAAGSVLPRSRSEREPGLWAGVPATHRGAVSGAWFDRDETSTHDLWIPQTDEIVPGR